MARTVGFTERANTLLHFYRSLKDTTLSNLTKRPSTRLRYLPGPLISANFPADCTRPWNESKHQQDNAQQPSNSEIRPTHHTFRRRKIASLFPIEIVESALCPVFLEREGTNTISGKQLRLDCDFQNRFPLTTRGKVLVNYSRLCRRLCILFVSKIIIFVRSRTEKKKKAALATVCSFNSSVRLERKRRDDDATRRNGSRSLRVERCCIRIKILTRYASVARANNARERSSPRINKSRVSLAIKRENVQRSNDFRRWERFVPLILSLGKQSNDVPRPVTGSRFSIPGFILCLRR